MMTNVINPDEYYSLSKTVEFLPWIKSAYSLQKLIDNDIAENDNQLFNAIVIKRNVQKRYYIKGQYILEVIEKANNGEITQK